MNHPHPPKKFQHDFFRSNMKNSNDTIEWFGDIKNKSKTTFTQFDIIDFYPSITEKGSIIDSINYARKYVEITEQHKNHEGENRLG